MKLWKSAIIVVAMTGGSTSALAQAAQWMGGATLTFSPATTACTGVVNSNPPSANGNISTAAGSNTGFGGFNTGFSAYNKSSQGGGGFVFVFDEPLFRYQLQNTAPNANAGFVPIITDVYNRKFIVSALSGGVAGILFPNVAVTGSPTYSYPSISFNRTDLQGSIVVNYTASGASCQLNASFLGTDSGNTNH